MSNKNYGIGLRGAVLILVLLAVAITVTGVLYGQNTSQVQEVSLQEPIVETVAVVTQSTQAPSEPSQIAATRPASVPAMASEPSPVPAEPAAAEEPQVLKTAPPVSGSTIGEYAVDCLSYNETTRDWRIHNGIDLAAEVGSPVYAAADGTVYTTYEDDNLGYTVVIRHRDGYTTRYSSLREDLCVHAGDAVSLGQTIGYAGDSALVETAMGAHVHFSVSYQDKPMDPADFITLG